MTFGQNKGCIYKQAGMFSNTFFPIFDNLYSRPSVYVISDSQLAEYKRNQAEAEITELNKLIDHHKQAIERLMITRDLLRKDYPELQPTNTENDGKVTLG